MSFLDFSTDASDPNNPNAALVTPDQIARRQQMAAELMKQGSDYSPVRSPWQGVARMANAALGGFMNYKLGTEAQEANKSNSDALTAAMLGLKGGAGGAAGATPGGLSLPSMAQGGSSVPKMTMPMPASAGNLAPWQTALLNGIAAPESAGAYNVRYTPNGGATFAGFDAHPGVFEPGPSGPSSAAGRYQFTKTTWDGLGGGAFTPAAQDQRAIQLAQQDYKARTGRDLGTDLQANGMTPQIAKALAPTWAGLGSNPQKAISAYNSTLGSLGNKADLPAPGAVNAGGAPLPPGAAAFGAGGAPQADAGLSSAMFDQNKMGGGATDYTLGSRGLNDNNNGAGMTEIAPGSIDPMSARTAGKLGGGAPEATSPAQLQMVARLLRGDAAPAPAPAAAATAPSQSSGSLPFFAGVAAPASVNEADIPAPGATNAGPAPVPPGSPAPPPNGAMADDQTFKQILAGTAYRAANPHPGDQMIPLDQLRPGSAAYPNMEGSPEAAQAQQASQAKAAQAGQAVQLQQLMGVIQNPYTSPAQRQVATLLLQKYMGQEQWKDATGPNGMVGQRNTVTGEFKPLAEQADQKWGVIGEDAMGRKQYGRPPAPGTQPAPPAVAPGANPDVMNLHGEDFIKTLDPGIQTQVKAIVEGRAPYPTGMLLKTPYGQQLAQFVTQADPSFDTANATSRTKVRNEFNAGGPSSPAGAITAGNTAIQHLGHLSDAAESLGNSDSSFPGAAKTYNVVKNALSSGKDAVPLTEFNNIVGKYVEEATKFYRGTGGTESDIQRDLSHLNPNMTPSELHAAIKTQAELLQSKINALQDRWKQGMGPLVPDFPIVHPESAKQMETIRKRAGGEAPAPQAAPATQAAPQSGAPVQKTLGGKTYENRNGNWYEVPSV